MENLRGVELDSPLNRKVPAFLAVGPPPEEWFDALDQWLLPLQRRLNAADHGENRIKWMDRKSYHLVFRFFGSVSAGDILEFQEDAKRTSDSFRPLSLSLSGLLFFPEEATPPLKPRINEEITAAQIRVFRVGADSMETESLETALKAAQREGCDLIEFHPAGNPPICVLYPAGEFDLEQWRNEHCTSRFIGTEVMALAFNDETRQIGKLEKFAGCGLARSGEKPETGPFRAHIPIAEIDHANGWQRRFLFDLWTEGGAPQLPLWTVRKVSLFESKRKAGSWTYSPVAEFPLTL